MSMFSARMGLLAFLLGSLVGCKKLEEARKVAEAAASAAAGERPGETAVDKDQATSDKLAGYIGCLNDVSPRVLDSRNRYLQWVKDEKVGPTGKERNVYGLYDVNADHCSKELEKSKATAPPLAEIDAAAAAYRAALDELLPLVKEANKYYDQSDYKDDKMAKGKEMHGPLMAAFAKFEAANAPLDDKVTTLNDEIAARRLNSLARDPKRHFQYLIERSLLEGKHLVRLADVKTLDALDAERYAAKLEVFGKTLDELESYADSHKDEASKVSMFSVFLGDAKDYLKAAKDLSRRKRDKKDFNKEFFSGNAPQMVEGHPAKVVSEYNEMVSRSNHLRRF